MSAADDPQNMALYDALSGLSQSELTNFQVGNTKDLKTNLANNLADAFQPSLNSSIFAANNYDVMQNYKVSSKNLDTTLGDLKGQQSTNLNIASRNVATASRYREIKEWYYNNKLDTLFIFQLIFISVLFLAVLAYLMKMNLIGTAVFGAMIGILIVINVLVISNRAIYTDKVRDKRYWSKRNFGIVGSPLPGGILAQKCP